VLSDDKRELGDGDLFLCWYRVEVDRFCEDLYKHTACFFSVEANGVRTPWDFSLMIQVVRSFETLEHV